MGEEGYGNIAPSQMMVLDRIPATVDLTQILLVNMEGAAKWSATRLEPSGGSNARRSIRPPSSMYQ